VPDWLSFPICVVQICARPPLRYNDGAMPTILRVGPYRFYFYSYDCGELRHTHADRDSCSAKFWLDPDASLATNHGYSRKELRNIEHVVRENLELLRNEWDEFCRGYIS